METNQPQPQTPQSFQSSEKLNQDFSKLKRKKQL
jgi:hypothetical protein